MSIYFIVGLLVVGGVLWMLHAVSSPYAGAIDERTAAAISEHTLRVDGNLRHYLVYDGDGQAVTGQPLWLFLHGGGQSMELLRDGSLTSQQLLATAAAENIVLIVPNGTNKETGRFDAAQGNRWNDLRVEDPTKATANGPYVEAIDDVEFLSRLVEQVQRDYGTVQKQTYIAGISNGGSMAQYMVIERPELFNAGASLIASVSVPMTEADRKPSSEQRVPMLFWHGSEDTIVQFNGTPQSMLAAGDAVAWWAEAYSDNEYIVVSADERQGSDRAAEVMAEGTAKAAAGECYTADLRTYHMFAADDPDEPLTADTPVVLKHVVTFNNGHTVPSKTYTYADRPLVERIITRHFGTICDDIDAIPATWEFLASY